MNNWKELDKQYIMNTGHRRLDIVAVKGKGNYLWDENGKKYIDFVGGWAVNSLGHCHPLVVKTLQKQAKELLVASADIYTVPAIRLAQLLCNYFYPKHKVKAFFQNSGAEANEAAIKLARKYGKLYLNGAYEVISTLNSFHGRTLAMVAATGKPHYQEPYLPLPDGFINVPYNDIEAIKNVTTDKTCAILLEPIQGEGGVIIPDPYYFKEIRKWCDKKGILLILDEVQTGCGRTGKLFAHEWDNISPDIMTLGKGLGSGVPISTVLAFDKADVFGPSNHGSTFGGNPLMCSVAYEVLEYIMKENLSRRSFWYGRYFRDKLVRLNFNTGLIKEVRGKGLLLAVEFKNPIAETVVKEAKVRGLLLNLNHPNVIRLMPSLLTTEKEINEVTDILSDILRDII